MKKGGKKVGVCGIWQDLVTGALFPAEGHDMSVSTSGGTGGRVCCPACLGGLRQGLRRGLSRLAGALTGCQHTS